MKWLSQEFDLWTGAEERVGEEMQLIWWQQSNPDYFYRE